VIRTIRHKGLKRPFEEDDPSGVNPEHADKPRDILATLHAAPTVADLDLPGFGVARVQRSEERNRAINMKNPPHPGGVVLRQCIEPLGLTITGAAAALGVTRNTLSELVHGKRGISPEMAVRLSKVFGGAEDGWLVQQARYDLAQVRRDHIKLKRLQLA
jgi:addiction module HigA family antidote